MSSDEDGLEYVCTNDACPRRGTKWQLWSEAGEACCPSCGWFMAAVYE